MLEKEALDSLRKEIQIDRIETQRTIQEGFKDLSTRLDNRAEFVTKLLDETDTRLTVIETKASTIGKAVWALFIIVVTAAVGYGFSHL